MFAVTSTSSRWARALFVGAALVALPGLAVAETYNTRDAVHSTTTKVVTSTSGDCVRTKWSGAEDQCSDRVALTQEDLTVYFKTGSAQLTPAGKATLDKLAKILISDKQVKDATIVGYADRMGGTAYNDALSQRRAKAVRDYLTAQGFMKTQIAETRWFGETRPATDCPTGLSRKALVECLQKDRRVEVEITYLPTQPKVTSFR